MAPRERAPADRAGEAAFRVLERGISVLFTEHSMDVVFAPADRIIVLSRGRPTVRRRCQIDPRRCKGPRGVFRHRQDLREGGYWRENDRNHPF